MSMTTCRECGGAISTQAAACPHCGAPQPQPPTPNGQTGEKRQMSTKKILSIISLCLAGVGVFFGGLAVRIAALVTAIIALKSKDGEEPEADTYAKIALIVSAVLIALGVVSLLFWSGFAARFLRFLYAGLQEL